MAGLGVTTTLSSSLGLFLQSMARKWLSTDNSVSPEREGGGRVRGVGGGGWEGKGGGRREEGGEVNDMHCIQYITTFIQNVRVQLEIESRTFRIQARYSYPLSYWSP